MEKIEVTSVSSRGQVVIPLRLREKLGIHEGEKFIVMGESDTIIFKKLEISSFKGFEKLLKKTREFAKKRRLKESDIKESIKEARDKKAKASLHFASKSNKEVRRK